MSTNSSAPAETTVAASRPSAPPPTAALPTPAAQLAERRAIIAEIHDRNATAKASFLNGFSTQDLRDYLEHLRHARHKEVRLAGWVQRRLTRLATARREVSAVGPAKRAA